MTRSYDQLCGIARALDLIGERWTLLIMRDLLLGPLRFGELLELEEGIGANLLSKRLKSLIERGWVVDERRGRERIYSATREGERLRPVLLALGAFGGAYLDPSAPVRRRLSWFVFSMQRRLRPTAPPVCVRLIDDAQRMFVIRTSDPIEVRRGDSVGVDVEVQASFPVLAEWLVRGTSWRTLQDDGRMQVTGDEAAVERFVNALER